MAVKFCCPGAAYGEEVHRLWASVGLAPRLLAATALPGAIQMIVMEALVPEDGWACLGDQPPDGQAMAHAAVVEGLRRAQALLSFAHLVGRRYAHLA